MLEEVNHLAQQNHGDRGRVDELFQHRSALEGQGRDVEGQLMQQHNELAAKLEAVDPGMKEKFLQMSQKQQVLSVQELPKRQSDLAFFDERVREMETAVSRDPGRAKAFRLREDIDRLQRLHHALSEELDGPQMTDDQKREMLLARVKADNAEIAEHERTLVEAQQAIKDGKKQLSQLKNDVADANDPKAQKYQELFARDKEVKAQRSSTQAAAAAPHPHASGSRSYSPTLSLPAPPQQMSELIDSFEPTKARETANIERAQATIVQLLQSVSRRLGMSENVDGMSKSKLDEMNDDLEFKQSQMDHSISTSERLQRELQQRKLELEKISSLDEKISVELAQLEEKKEQMERELVIFEDLPKLRQDAADAKEAAAQKKAFALSRIGDLKQQAAAKKRQYDQLKKQLASDDVATALDELEQKMRHHEQVRESGTHHTELRTAHKKQSAT